MPLWGKESFRSRLSRQSRDFIVNQYSVAVDTSWITIANGDDTRVFLRIEANVEGMVLPVHWRIAGTPNLIGGLVDNSMGLFLEFSEHSSYSLCQQEFQAKAGMPADLMITEVRYKGA